MHCEGRHREHNVKARSDLQWNANQRTHIHVQAGLLWVELRYRISIQKEKFTKTAP